MFARITAGCAAVLAVAACSATAGPAAHPTAGPRRSAASPARHRAAPSRVGRLGSYRVGQRWMMLAEPAHRGVTGAWLGQRQLLTQVLYPAASGRFPLIVFAPGFMQCGGPYSPMLRSWASAGYVVVVVDFPKSDCKVGAAATESDMVNQPGDMSFVIGQMLRGPLSASLNPREIAIAGQSDGGDTVGAIAANSCCDDHRVVAVAVLSGAEWPPMPGRYFARRPVPVLIAQGSADRVNWPGCSVQMYRADSAPARYYLDLFGASHVRPYWGVNRYEHVMVAVGLAFFDRFVLGRAAADGAMRRAGNVPHVAALYSAGQGRLAQGPCNN